MRKNGYAEMEENVQIEEKKTPSNHPARLKETPKGGVRGPVRQSL